MFLLFVEINESSFLLFVCYSLILYSASRASHMAARDVLLGRNRERRRKGSAGRFVGEKQRERKGVREVRDVFLGGAKQREARRKGRRGTFVFGKGYKTLFMGKEGGVAFCLS